jgi:hypothetical protein
MEPIGCTETSANNYHYTLRNIPEEREYQIKVIVIVGEYFQCSKNLVTTCLFLVVGRHV